GDCRRWMAAGRRHVVRDAGAVPHVCGGDREREGRARGVRLRQSEGGRGEDAVSDVGGRAAESPGQGGAVGAGKRVRRAAHQVLRGAAPTVIIRRGGRAWSIAPDSKSGVPARVPGVRIPPSPPTIFSPELWRDARVAEGARLEIVCAARYRGFESLSLRRS